MEKLSCLVASLILLTFLRPVLTLKCYICGYGILDCKDPVIFECSGVCATQKALADITDDDKAFASLFSFGNGITFKKGDVARSCLPWKILDMQCQDLEVLITCYCDTDLCNGSDVSIGSDGINGSEIIKGVLTTGAMAIVAVLLNFL